MLYYQAQNNFAFASKGISQSLYFKDKAFFQIYITGLFILELHCMQCNRFEYQGQYYSDQILSIPNKHFSTLPRALLVCFYIIRVKFL